MKKKLAFVVWSLAGMGGSEKVVYDIVRGLDKRRFSSIIVSFEDGPLKSLYEKMGVKTYCTCKTKKIDFEFVRRFREILIDERVEIINPHHFSPLLYTFIATRFSSIKVVYTEHSRWQLEQLSLPKKIANRFILGNIDAIIAISNQIRDYYTNNLRISKDRIHLISNGIDVTAFQNVKDNGLRSKLGIEQNEFVIGIIAHIRPEKNHKLLVSAFSSLLETCRNVRLVVVGQDFMNGELQSFTRQLGIAERVLFLGKRDDVPDLLKTFDIFCLPSIKEGLPLTILEAMAAGVPVIGADVLGINEVVKHNENGLLFPSNDQKKLKECLVLLLKDDPFRRHLSCSGENSVEKKYSLNNMIAQYENIFNIM